MGASRGRMGRHRPQLHFGNHWEPQRGRLPPPRRVFARRGEPSRVEHAGPPRVPLDPSHVPLQRLVLPLVSQHQRGNARVPSEGNARLDSRSDTSKRGHSPVRRADRDADDRRCRGAKGAADRRGRRGRDRRRSASGTRHPGDGGSGVSRHPSLRFDGDLRPGGGELMAPGVGRAAASGARLEESSSGSPLSRARRLACREPRDTSAPCPPTERRWARSSFAATW